MSGTPQVEAPAPARAEVQPARSAPPGSLAAVLDRYRPAALAVAAILAVVTVLPGADEPGGSGGFDAASAVPVGGVAAPELGLQPEAPAEPVVAPEAPTLVAEPVSAGLDLPDAAPLDTGFDGLPAAPAEDAPAPSADEPLPPPGDAPAPPPAAGPAPAPAQPAAEPLTLAASGWASRTAGTPLAAQGVPAGSLPVGLRVGVLDKASFLRLDGTATQLVLREVAGGTRGSDPAAFALRACQITDKGWEEAEAQSFDEAPAYDEAACADGTRSTSGAWTFDLAGFSSRADDRGFALVPGESAPTDFQVALQL